jgi:FlaA1/EpsC-like NDP-sugar epimerase
MGNGGEIFVFEMGTPVKIADLARRMIELSGLTPDRDILIVYTGLRQDEKLYEELLSNEELTKPTPHEKIRVASVKEYDYDVVAPRIELLVGFSYEVNIPEMVKEMKSLVPEYKSQNSEFQKYDKEIYSSFQPDLSSSDSHSAYAIPTTFLKMG